MREISQLEIGSVSGGITWGEATGLSGGGSGYGATAATYGRGLAVVAGLTFGLPGALACGVAFSVGWGVGSLINKFSTQLY